MSLSIKEIKKCKPWNWDVWMLQNQWITLTIVPAIGGRIMEYTLNGKSLIYSNPAWTGKISVPAADQDWPNFGGYKVWPAPQEAWDWPPPPTLDHGAYHAEVEHESDEEITLLLKSPVEQWGAPGLRLERRVRIRQADTRVFLKETLINESDESVSWSIWDITQQIMNHPDQDNYDNFWAYFPVNKNSRYGNSGVRYTGESDAWKGEVAPGIFGVQGSPNGLKIFADAGQGWIGYADMEQQLVTTKTFPVYPGRSYPDDEARVAVYMNKGDLPYVEIEVMGPVVHLAPGAETSFSIDWGIAHANAPMLEAMDRGVVSQRLTEKNGKLTAQYGVFQKGSVCLVFRDMRGVMLKKTLPKSVSPLKPVLISQSAEMHPDVRLIEVQFNGQDGHTIGVLDALEILPEK